MVPFELLQGRRQGGLDLQARAGLVLARLDEEVEVGGADLLVLDQDDEALHDVHQLADVARPGVVEEGLRASSDMVFGFLP